MNTPRWLPVSAFALSLGFFSSLRAAQAVAPLANDVAIVATKDALLRIDTSDAKATELTHEPTTWCAVDNRAQVLWYLVAEPEPAATPKDHTRQPRRKLALKVLDLRSPGSVPLEVSRSDKAEIAAHVQPLIAYADGRVLGAEQSGHGPDITLTLELARRPTLKAAEVCVPELPDLCLEEGLHEKRPLSELPEALKDTALTLRALRRMQLQNVDKLTEFVERGKQRSLYFPTTERPLPPVRSVPTAPCKIGGCGTAVVIPGTLYWAVTVASEPGDHAEYALQFYDPARRLFFNPRRVGAVSKLPFTAKNQWENHVSGMLIAPSGRKALMNDELIDFERGVLRKSERGCGWLNGGWYFSQRAR